jgi:hypothetical protein
MPVDQATLARYITDVAGDDKELADMLREKLGAKEDAATRFVNGHLRNDDYTKKTQDLAKQRAALETSQTDYESRLTAAEAEKDQIMKDLADERVTASKATALLKTVKQAYGLTDNDLPGIDDIKATAKTGTVVDSTPDLDKRLDAFEQKLMDRVTKQLIPEISGLAILGPVWNEIGYEHQQLFSKRLTKTEQAEILKDAREKNTSLETIWAEKYGVPERRLEVRDEGNKAKWQREWSDEQAKKSQEAILRGTNPDSGEFQLADRQSPIFKRNFEPTPEPGTGTKPNSESRDNRMSGAERAAAKFMERAKSGNLGKPLEPARSA